MGKDLKGKELGVGISQRKDGLYTARITDNTGKRRQKYFKKLQECRKWIADEDFRLKHNNVCMPGDMTVDAWFRYWIEHIKGNNIRPNTIRNYTERYEKNIKKYIGDMVLSDVKPMHCQLVLDKMAKDYRQSTIEQTRITLGVLFRSAVDNDIISNHPLKDNVRSISKKESKKMRVLTIEEQKKFLKCSEKSSNFNQFCFILQTGLRTGEMIGLKWSDLDLKNRLLHVNRTMEYRHSVGEWRVGEPKSKSGKRCIPLTGEAVDILLRQKKKNSKLKVVSLEHSEFVFLNRNGEPTKNSAYDTCLQKLCEKNDIEHFSMHTLRHTFATRCIESGMKPKTLQMILGHANIGITMNLYVHITDDEKKKEMEMIESMLKMG
jgi:integrase